MLRKKTLNVSNIIQYTSISLDFETFENLNGLVMEESVYSGGNPQLQFGDSTSVQQIGGFITFYMS